MKTMRYTLLVLLACLSLSGCQEVEEPANTVPVVITDAVEKFSGNFAYLSGTVSSRAECYFLISTSEDMNDARKVVVYPYKNEESGKWICVQELGDLVPGTTYYVMLCATDRRSEVKGNVVSFTTSAYLTIESVKVGEKDYDSDIIGVYLANSNQYINPHYGNMRAERNVTNIGYKLPYNIILSESSYKVYAYAPYDKSNSVERMNEIKVWTRGVNDWLYGSCTVTSSEPKANIKMQSALARLRFIISTDSKKPITFSYINLRNAGNKEALFISGKLDLVTGRITPEPIWGHDGILMEVSDNTIRDGVHSIAEMLVIPTSFKDEEIKMNVCIDGQLVEIPISATTWEAGKTYEIPIKVNMESKKARIGDYYYSDGTWSTTYTATKECIGIVFALSEEKNGAINPNLTESLHGRIAALNDVEGTFAWSTEVKDTYFTNFSLLDGKNVYGELPYDGKTLISKTLPYGMYEWPVVFGEKYALTDYKGFNNMNVNGNLYPAISAARLATQNNIVWYLPALGELARLGMACAAGLLPGNVQLSGWTYWSSTECGTYQAWVYSVAAGTNHNHVAVTYDKLVQCHVRPVASF